MDESTLRRFWAKVYRGPVSECWLWQAGQSTGGYGQFWDGGDVAAHRASYEHHVGPIPVGLTLDHLCRVRSCVNPAHLEPVSNRVNVLRGNGACARHARKTHCLRGHAFTKENTRLNSSGSRVCRVCDVAKERARVRRR
jgi:hypothetical protein